jgi:putative peptidoglycan lipid II flippase
MVNGKTIVKGAAIVMAATLLSRLSGFFREMKIAEYFGSNVSTDAYLVAFSVPSGIGMAIAAAISAGFIPVLNSYLVSDDRNNASKVTNTILNLVFLILLGIVVIAIFTAPYLVKVLAPGFKGKEASMTVDLIRIMFPATIFVALMGLASGYLNSHRHFLFPALAPIITNISIIICAIVLKPVFGIKGLAIGAMAGFSTQFLLQLPVMYKKGFRYRFELALKHPGVVKFFKLMVPVLIASMVPSLMIMVERGLASKLTNGSISALNYAYRLMQLPLGLFVMAVSVPLFPELSSLAAKKDYKNLKSILVKGASVLAIIMLPASAGLIALDQPVVRLLFERGAFDAKDTIPTAYALAFYSIALMPIAVRDIFRRGFYALQDTLTPVVTTVIVLLLNVVLDIILVKKMGIGGLALGAALSAVVEAVVLYMLLNKRLRGLMGKTFAVLLAKLLLAASGMGVLTFYCCNLIGANLNLATNIGKVLQVGSSVTIGLAIFIIALIVLKVKELGEAAGMIGGLFKRIVRR